MITGWSFYVIFVVAFDFAADLISLANQPKYFSFKTKKLSEIPNETKHFFIFMQQ